VTAGIRPITYSDALFAPILAEAEHADGAFMLRVRDEWVSGVQRFEGPGEFLLGAFVGSELAGVGGVSRDPYDPRSGLGRVRHIYVLEERRREGIGRALVEAIIARARADWQVLRLRTRNPAAASLYEAAGFLPAAGDDETHLLRLRCARGAGRPAFNDARSIKHLQFVQDCRCKVARPLRMQAMRIRTDQDQGQAGRFPSPAAGLLFLLGGFGFLYSLITIVDPLL